MQPRLLPYAPERDVYRLLGVQPSASVEEINAACRRLARTFHPDRNTSERATQEMQVVNAVRRVLTDPQSRADYDRARHQFHAELGRRSTERALAWASVSANAAAASASRAATASRPAVPRPVAMTAASVSKLRPAPEPGASPIERYVRALLVSVRTIVASLLPPRCRRCRIVIDREDAYCAACGTPLLTGG